MYRKARIHLTLLFSAVTCTMLLALLAVSLLISGKSQFSLLLSNFTRQSLAAAGEASDQRILTTGWLTSKETSGSFYLFLLDQGTPVFHNSTHPESVRNMFDEIQPLFSGETYADSVPDCFFQSSEEESVYICRHGLLPSYLFYRTQFIRNNSSLQFFTILPLDELHSEIRSGILRDLLLFLLSGCILAAFCWYFTGRLLKPLLDGHESQNRFISAASHELRTPLAVILANASACEKAPKDRQSEFFRVIEREGRQMSVMLEQLLTLSRADSHSLNLQLTETDLQTLLLDVYEAFLPLAQKEHHLLQILLPEEDIPPSFCDAFRISQLCTILLQNALSYTPAGSRIILALSLHGKFAEISVQDNGPGIPDSEKTQIFGRFARGKDQDTQKGHHGLGLAVASEISHAHSGTLTVHDAPGGGSLFMFRFPLRIS